jgi:hypothetical protein
MHSQQDSKPMTHALQKETQAQTLLQNTATSLLRLVLLAVVSPLNDLINHCDP